MKNSKKYFLVGILAATGILTAVSVSSCSSDEWEIAHENQYSAENIYDFHSRNFSNSKADILDANLVDIYVDLSDGMAPAWAHPTNVSVFKTLLNRTAGKQNILPMGRPQGGAGNVDFDIKAAQNDGTLANKLMHPEVASKRIYAQLLENLEKLVGGGREAIFVSDFEEYVEDGNLEIAETPVYTEWFIKWLDRGNDIHLYRLPYKEGEHSKNLVIAMFTSSSNKNSTINKLISEIEEETGVVPEISFDHNPFKIDFQEYVKSDLHGTIVYNNDGAFETEGHNGWTTWDPSLALEIHSMPESWSYYLDESFQEYNKGVLSEGLLLNTHLNDFMSIKNVNVSVFDISTALELNSEINYFTDLATRIELTTDNGGNVIWSVSDLELQLLEEGFEQNSKTLKPRYAAPSFKDLYESLPLAIELDKGLYDDWMRNDPTKVKVHTNLNLSKIGSYAVDGEPLSWEIQINVDAIELNTNRLNSFRFTDPKGKENSSLSESLINVARHWEQHLLEKESRIYTYYLTKI